MDVAGIDVFEDDNVRCLKDQSFWRTIVELLGEPVG